MMDMDKMALCLKLVKNKKSAIIAQMNEFTADDSMGASEIRKVKEGKKQFNDVSEAANKASCVEEFKLYISYKAAKEGTRSTWGTLSKNLNQQVDRLKEIAEAIQEEAKMTKNVDLPMEEVHLEVIKSYMGYLMWKANILIEGK